MSSADSFTLRTDAQLLSRVLRQVADHEWPKTPAGASWQQGADPATMRFIADRWTRDFDWRAKEALLNQHPNFIATVDGLRLHFVHRRSLSTSSARRAVVLLHGWPSSYIEYLGVAERLTQTGSADHADMDAVIVSLPGCGFSDAPDQPMGPRAMADLVHRLMTEVLGYRQYLAHGSDWGSLIAGWLAFDQPASCIGIHMTMISPRFVAGAASEPAEQKWLADFRERFDDDGAYFRLQTSRPLTASYVLSDHPIGFLAWTLEKFAAWGDPALGDKSATFQTPENADRILCNAMLYLVTRSAATSMWIYRGVATEGPPGYPGGKRVEAPVAIAATRDPVFVLPPRSLVEKAYRVVRWTDYAQGGHFPGYEVPDLLADDIRAFAAGL